MVGQTQRPWVRENPHQSFCNFRVEIYLNEYDHAVYSMPTGFFIWGYMYPFTFIFGGAMYPSNFSFEGTMAMGQREPHFLSDPMSDRKKRFFANSA
jgi:hypothetical protein